jgi:hypothetical protein
VFTLKSVRFIPTATVPIWPIPLTLKNRTLFGASANYCGTAIAYSCTTVPADQVFADTTVVLPDQFVIHSYQPPLLVGPTENACSAASDVAVRATADGLGKNDYPIGVFFSGEGAMANGCTHGRLFESGTASAVLDAGRSLTSVSHEIGHGLGLPHADTGKSLPFCLPLPVHQDNCGPHPDNTPDCAGNSYGQVGETWPPGADPSVQDNEGRLDSLGLDRRHWFTLVPGSLPTVMVEGFDSLGNPSDTRLYDLMSYCPAGGVSDAQDWISVFNWERLVNYHPPANTLPARPRLPGAATAPPLRVMAVIDSSGNTSIVHVVPGQQAPGGPTPGSPFRIQLRDSHGNILESVVPTTAGMHVDFSGKPAEMLLDATLPFAPATANAVVTSNGQVTAQAKRSPHAPTAKFISPRKGTQLGTHKTTTVRWSEHDADGDRLTSAIDYSLDGGRHWRVVADGLTGTSAAISSRFLSASKNARLRVRISDGFNTTTVVSGRLRSRGVAPVVQILGAPRSGRVVQTETVVVEGSAFDDAGRPLTGRHLTWYLGKRRVGRGAELALSGMQPANTTLRLVATDSQHRSSKASIRLRITAAPPRYLLFLAPELISAKARSVTIKVAAGLPATLTIAGKRYTVGPKAIRTIKVRIKPGKSLLELKCTLRSRGGVVTRTYVAFRH